MAAKSTTEKIGKLGKFKTLASSGKEKPAGKKSRAAASAKNAPGSSPQAVELRRLVERAMARNALFEAVRKDRRATKEILDSEGWAGLGAAVQAEALRRAIHECWQSPKGVELSLLALKATKAAHASLWEQLAFAAISADDAKSLRAIGNQIDLKAINEPKSANPLTLQAAREASVACASFLLDAGFDFKAKNPKTGASVLHECASGSPEKLIFAREFARHCDVNAVDAKGKTPLHLAVGSKAKQMILFLLSAGANPDAQNEEGLTPLMVAAQTGEDDNVRALAMVSDLSARDKNGDTVLDAAVRCQDWRALDVIGEARGPQGAQDVLMAFAKRFTPAVAKIAQAQIERQELERVVKEARAGVKEKSGAENLTLADDASASRAQERESKKPLRL